MAMLVIPYTKHFLQTELMKIRLWLLAKYCVLTGHNLPWALYLADFYLFFRAQLSYHLRKAFLPPKPEPGVPLCPHNTFTHSDLYH